MCIRDSPCASWLLIRATRGSKVLAYSVYLGENNTSDFNVRANCHYRLNITLLNDNTADTRIAAYTAAVYDDFDDGNIGGYCVYDPDYSQMCIRDRNTPAFGRIFGEPADAVPLSGTEFSRLGKYCRIPQLHSGRIARQRQVFHGD